MAELELPEVFEPLLQPARFKGAYGGRGSGKSHAFAGIAVVRMYSEPGFRIVCIREVQNSIKDSVKQLLEDKIKALGLAPFFKVTDTEIEGKNGSRAIFRGMQNHTAEAVKSLEAFDVAWFEEAQTATAISLEILTPTIRKPGSELWFSWNPRNEDDPVDKMLRGDKRENAIVIKANWQDNPHFPAVLLDDLRHDQQHDPDKYMHVWEGHYRSMSETRVFRNWRIGQEETDPRTVWHYGVDFGFSVDPAAAVRCTLIGDRKLYIDHEAYEVGVPTEALPSFLDRVPGIRAWTSRADSARPETIDYLRRNGFGKMRGATKGKGSVEDGVSFLQGMEIIVHPRCINMAAELRAYAYRTDKRTGEILPLIEDAHNHLIDALRYAVERLHRKGRLVPLREEERDDRLQKPPDYREREETDSWKVV
jgi:phage terminase large subunit